MPYLPDMGSHGFFLFSGNTWLVTPRTGGVPEVTIGGTPRMMHQYPLDNGWLLITDQPHKPEVSEGWDCVPYAVPDGLTVRVDNFKVRHVHTLYERPDEVYAFFAGLVAPPSHHS